MEAIQNTPVMQAADIPATILTAVGSYEGTCGLNTKNISVKKHTESKPTTTKPVLETRGCSSVLFGIGEQDECFWDRVKLILYSERRPKSAL